MKEYNDQAMKALIDGIKYINQSQPSSYDKTYTGTITKVTKNSDSLYYSVKINGVEYPNIISQIPNTLVLGQSVKVTVPQNQYSQMYISGTTELLPVDIYIIESGVLRGWNYVKYSNGTADCWTDRSFTFTGSTGWVSPWYFADAPAINFPFTFSRPPVCNYDKYTYSQLTILTIATNVTASQTPVFRILKPSSFGSSVEMRISIRATGTL